jgi:hypothetical protein
LVYQTAMPDLDEFALAKLAREMAMAVRDHKEIFKDFDITEESYYEITKNEFYKRAKDQFAIEWNSALSATDRVKVISASYLEQMLPVLGAKATDPKENTGAATEIAKLFSRNAGIGEGKTDGKSASERFIITINLGSDTEGKPMVEKFDKSVAIDVHDVGTAGEAGVVVQLPAPAEDTGPIDFFDGIDDAG